MIRIVLGIYDRIKKHPVMGWICFILVTAGLIASFIRLSYKEDITDFLPLDEDNQTALSVYQDISGANKILAIVSTRDTVQPDPEELTQGVDAFVNGIETADTAHYISSVVSTVDMDRILDLVDVAYDNIPYFIKDEDYARIDSLLSIPGYIEEKLGEDKQMLLFPSSNMLVSNIARDPLDLFSPISGRLQRGGMSIDFETYDGYILSPDGRKAIIIFESASGAHESDNNGKLTELLLKTKDDVESVNPNLDIHIIGGPVIAVANANRIKTDSILAVVISGILILALLIYVFRNVRNILLIVISIGWGWLFAMAAIALYYNSISIIVIGITSVMLGIAVNYPLHLIDHLKESARPRAALAEIVSPLIVGNITTVGAFLCLVPLNSPALHDLGLFSSLLLVGTILFVLIFLPHAVKIRKVSSESPVAPSFLARITSLKPEESKIIVWTVLILTIVFAVFSFKTEFDSDIRHINYMTEEQKEDMAYFQSLTNSSEDTEDLFVVSFGDSWDEAIQQNEIIDKTIDSLVKEGKVKRREHVSSFMASRKEQERKLKRWEDFVAKYDSLFSIDLPRQASGHGFSEQAFEPFADILYQNYDIRDFEEYEEFINTVFTGSLSNNNKSGKNTVVQTLTVPKQNVDEARQILSDRHEFGGMAFDVKSMNGSIANSLSDDFNYIGFVCGAIVFFFLWISLGRIELAIISFLPMAVSWIWILGIMGMLGIQFNIVNIILATFIFGQGDDYTIFITEGLSYEYAYRKKVLDSYKNSIVVSALIMFIGIGTLLFAGHPALRSLGEVTVVGMLSVVLMAYLFPPLVFNWLVRKNGKLRYQPITLTGLFRKQNAERQPLSLQDASRCAYRRYIYKGLEIERKALKRVRLIRKHSSVLEEILAKQGDIFILDEKGQGELALTVAMLYPDRRVYCLFNSGGGREVFEGCLVDLSNNVSVMETPVEDYNVPMCIINDKEIKYVGI